MQTKNPAVRGRLPGRGHGERFRHGVRCRCGYALRHLPRLNLRGPITADDNFTGFRCDRLAGFRAAHLVAGDEPVGGFDDLRCGAVIAIDEVGPDIAIFARKVQDEPPIRGPERIERLVVVADRP